MQPGTMQGRALGGRYEVGAPLGSGGMADVYEGRDLRLDRPVAIKVLRPQMAANPDVRRRFEAEARTAARLSHPNVVGVFDTGEDDGVPYIVMERLPGETLADRMARGRVDDGWLSRAAGDVLLALGAAHAAGLVHRDVKPGNILISREGCAKVADFGIAKSTEPLPGEDATATNILIGTPSYLAPERIDGGVATPQTDLYAVGVLLYEALAGRKPFTGSTPVAVAHAVRTGQYPPLREVRPDADPRLVAAIERAMARNPADRFASADEMRAAVEGRAPVRAPGHADTVVMAAPGAVAGAMVEGAATTVMSTDHTVVAPAPSQPWPRPPAPSSGPGTPGAPTAAGRRPVPAATRRRRPGVALVAIAGLLLGVLLVALATVLLAGHHGASAASTHDRALASQLRSAASRVRTGDGPQGAATADRLGKMASSLDDGKPVAADATSLLADVTTWARSGQLSGAAASLVSPLLVDAGADPSAGAPSTTAPPATAPPTTAAAARAPAPGPKPKPGKGHGKGD